MSAFDYIVEQFLQAVDLYTLRFNEADRSERAALTAAHYTRLDSISNMARRAGVNVGQALDRALSLTA